MEQKLAIARPFSVYYSDPKALEASPETLLGRITSQQQKQAIRGVKKVSQRLLLVYPRTIDARAHLEATQGEWLQQIGGTLARKLYYVVVSNIDPLEVLETLRTQAQDLSGGLGYRKWNLGGRGSRLMEK